METRAARKLGRDGALGRRRRRLVGGGWAQTKLSARARRAVPAVLQPRLQREHTLRKRSRAVYVVNPFIVGSENS